MTTSSEFVPVYEIAERMFGTRPSSQSIHRWVRAGVADGVILQAVRHNGTWYCKEEWFEQFISDQTSKVLGS